jgi:hypothetical protein
MTDFRIGDLVVYRPTTGGEFRGVVTKLTALRISLQMEGPHPWCVYTKAEKLTKIERPEADAT